MAETKIKFTKNNIRKIAESELAPGTKGLELEIKTDFLMSQLCSLKGIVHGPIQDAPFEEISFVFKDDTEKAAYDALLDNQNQTFELSFDKEKVFLNVAGFGVHIDKTKPEISMIAGDKSLVIFLESKFAGIITLENKPERERERDEDDDDNQDDKPTRQEINDLKVELEQAKKDKEKLQKAIAKTEKLGQNILNKNKELEDSLKKAKDQLKDLEKQTVSDKGFWRKEVIIPLALVLITVLLGLVIYFKKRSKK